MLTRPRVSRRRSKRVASKQNCLANLGMLNLWNSRFSWFVFDVQLVFAHVDLAVVGAADASVFAAVVLLRVVDSQTVSLLLKIEFTDKNQNEKVRQSLPQSCMATADHLASPRSHQHAVQPMMYSQHRWCRQAWRTISKDSISRMELALKNHKNDRATAKKVN